VGAADASGVTCHAATTTNPAIKRATGLNTEMFPSRRRGRINPQLRSHKKIFVAAEFPLRIVVQPGLNAGLGFRRQIIASAP